ncbi:MAG: hypothetical protein ACREXT_09580 [Gammaproteobacteria bacterium]
MDTVVTRLLALSESDARYLEELLSDLQAYCATSAQALDRIHKEPNAAARLLEHAGFIADIRERLGHAPR